MIVDSSHFIKDSTIAVALSGGCDSMALFYYLLSVKDDYGFNLKAINVEHGIRGQSSINDSLFVKNYCDSLGVPLISFSVDAVKKAEKEKLSIEQSARILRYECFDVALSRGDCDLIATAHHIKDNFESVLLNIFRGTGIKGLRGITEYSDKIIRPFLSVKKSEIVRYVEKHKIPFVQDETNFDDNYKRNFIRNNVLNKIEEVFPNAEESVLRLSETATLEDEFLDKLASDILTFKNDCAEIKLPQDKVLISRASIIALKNLGIEKDWEKIHVDDICSLIDKENGKMINLPKGIIATKEYDKIVISKRPESQAETIPLFAGEKKFGNHKISIEQVPKSAVSFCDGLYVDKNKIPKTAVVRTKRMGDVFEKFGGGTKKLVDYLTDKKIPLRLRDTLPLLCDGNDVLAIFGVEISDKVKTDEKSELILKLSIK